MKVNYLLTASAIFCLSLFGYGQTGKFSGCVINDEDKPVAGLVVTINGKKAVTRAKDGRFDIELSSVALGSHITISLEDQKWSILNPFLGRTYTQNSQTTADCTPIFIAPKKSPRFLGQDALSALTKALSDAEGNIEIKPGSLKSETEAVRAREKERVLKAYEYWSGFDVEVINVALQERRKFTNALGTSREADTAYLAKEYNKSGFLYRNSAINHPAWEKNDSVTLEDQKIIIKHLMSSGTVFFLDYNYKDSLLSFEMLEKKYFENGKFSDNLKYEWLELKYFIGRTKVQLSSEAKLDESTTLLNQAIANYNQALSLAVGNEFLEKQGMLQYGLGTALLKLGENRYNLKDDVSSINQAIRAFEKSADLFVDLKRADESSFDPRDIQMSIGISWTRLGNKTNGRESTNYFNTALRIFGQLEKNVQRNEDKTIWANLNYNIGIAHSDLAKRFSDPETIARYLKNAVDAFQEAETAYKLLLETPQNSCVSCAAKSLINFGTTLSELEQIVSDTTAKANYKNKALETFEKADEIINTIKREKEPFTWADSKAILGDAFHNLAVKSPDPIKNAIYLEKAAKAYEEAFTLINQGYCHSCAIQLQIILGDTLSRLEIIISDSVKRTDITNKALDSLDKADKAIDDLKNDGRPLTWAVMKNDLGRVFYNLAFRTGDSKKRVEYLNRGTRVIEDSYTLLNQDNCSTCIVAVLIDLSGGWDYLERNVDNSDKIAEYRSRMLVTLDKANKAVDDIKRKEEPTIWIGLKTRLGDAFYSLAERIDDPAQEVDYLVKASRAYEDAAIVASSLDESEDNCPPCTSNLLFKLGFTWNVLRQITKDAAKSAGYLNKSLETFEKANKVLDSFKNTENKTIWGSMKTDLGQRFAQQSFDAGDPKTKAEYLNKAETIFKEVDAYYTTLLTKRDYCSSCAIHLMIDLGNVWDVMERNVNDPAKKAEYRSRMLDALDKADKSIDSIKTDEQMSKSGLKARLAEIYSDLAAKTNDPVNNAKYVGKANLAYEEEFKFYTALIANKDNCLPCLTSSLSRLGTAWTMLGERAVNSTDAEVFFNKALKSFDAARSVLKRNEDKFIPVNLNLDLGRTYVNLALITNDSKAKAEYLDELEKIYNDAATHYPKMLVNQDYCPSCMIHTVIDLGFAWNVLEQNVDDPAKSAAYHAKALDALDKANKAIDGIKREPQTTKAELKARIGSAYSSLASRTNDLPTNAGYVGKAAQAYEEESKIYAALMANKDYCSPCATSSLSGLGQAWMILGERTVNSTDAINFYNNALKSLGAARNELKGDEDKLISANINMNFGRTYVDLADITNDPKAKSDYLRNAVTDYENAGKTYLVKDNPKEWTETNVNLAYVYLSLENWNSALELSNRVLENFPDDYDAFNIKIGVLHDGLFKFTETFELIDNWVARYPNHLSAKISLAEKTFTSENFTQCNQLINELLNNSETYVRDKIALRAIQIGCLLAIDQTQDVTAKLDILIDEVKTLPPNLRLNWSFRGIRHFVGQHKNLVAHKERLEKLFNILENNNSDSMLKLLNDLRAKFKN